MNGDDGTERQVGGEEEEEAAAAAALGGGEGEVDTAGEREQDEEQDEDEDEDSEEEEYEYEYDEDADEEEEEVEDEEEEDGAGGAGGAGGESRGRKARKRRVPGVLVLSTEVSQGSEGGTGVAIDGSYRVMTYGDAVPIMQRLINEVAGLLQVSDDVAHILLRAFKWDRERLLEVYYSDPDKAMIDSGVDMLAQASGNPQSAADALVACRICCEEVAAGDTFGLGCRHRFCRTCYSGYLDAQVADGPSCVQATCPEHKCKQMVPVSAFMELLSPDLVDKYQRYNVRNFIETSRTIRWCPAPGCDHVVMASGVTDVSCTCGMPFCFKCGEEAHAPVTCEWLQSWHQKCNSESETANWIIANTKRCPDCKTRIEKNQGCNHMTCRVCKYEFCWICMGDWKEHGTNTGGYYRCNRFDSDNKPTDDASQRAKKELDRYLHYYQRYHEHDRARLHASSHLENAERRMVQLQESEGSAWIDVQFLRNAVELIIECRRVLKYTYVLGYYLADGSPEKQLFEHHQENLEKFTEHLHHLAELPLETMDRTEVVNYTRVTERFMHGLLQSVVDGLENSDTSMEASVTQAGSTASAVLAAETADSKPSAAEAAAGSRSSSSSSAAAAAAAASAAPTQDGGRGSRRR